jgi:hypothetical protein
MHALRFYPVLTHIAGLICSAFYFSVAVAAEEVSVAEVEAAEAVAVEEVSVAEVEAVEAEEEVSVVEVVVVAEEEAVAEVDGK